MLIVAFLPVSLTAQKNCEKFDNFESLQKWIVELKKLDQSSSKDSIFDWIKCERFLNEQNTRTFVLDFFINGIRADDIPEYRDSLLSHIKAQNMILLNEHYGVESYPLRRYYYALLIEISKEPVIDNIDALTILKIKTKLKLYHLFYDRRTRIVLRCTQPQEFTLIIEDFCDKENNRTEKLYLKKGRKTLKFSVGSETKVISIIDSQNNFISVIN